MPDEGAPWADPRFGTVKAKNAVRTRTLIMGNGFLLSFDRVSPSSFRANWVCGLLPEEWGFMHYYCAI